MTAYYEQGKEQARLSGPKGALEFERTKEILQRRMPAAPADIADIGGGPGADALWLLDAARASERVPELLGLSPHLIATAILPPDARH